MKRSQDPAACPREIPAVITRRRMVNTQLVKPSGPAGRARLIPKTPKIFRMKKLLITGTDTGVGKTWISCLLVRQLAATGQKTGVYKPACSGAAFDRHGRPFWSDINALRNACGGDAPIDRICPQRFVAPLAPAVAARLEGRSIDSTLLVSGIECWMGHADTVIVEGVGGLLCPLSESLTVADLATEYAAPIVLVAANRLGVVNHTLLSIEVARSRGIEIQSVVLNDVSARASQSSANELDLGSDVSVESNELLLCHWVPDLPVFRCHFGGTELLPRNDAARQMSLQSRDFDEYGE